ncbi:MAG: LysE family transporter [Cyanothece sp. SIO2G6]|nr:LysE family transporter [Cyanothece sp. SIO2G6]
MITKILLTGIFIGFCIAFPFGGNAVLCAKNTLLHGGKSGISTGLGAATAHATYSLIGLSGLVAIESLLSQYLGPLELAGGLFLCYFGTSTILKEIPNINPSHENNPDCVEKQGLVKTYMTSTLFALTNPKSMILAAILITESGAFSIISQSRVLSLLIIISGIFIGSTLWWLMLVFSLNFLKEFLNNAYLVFLNRVFSVLVIVSGAFFSIFGLGKIWPLSYNIL